jgi:hypothetical protein
MIQWLYALSAIFGSLGVAALGSARAYLLIVGGKAKDRAITEQCAELYKLTRRDAKDLPDYLSGHSKGDERPALPARRQEADSAEADPGQPEPS